MTTSFELKADTITIKYEKSNGNIFSYLIDDSDLFFVNFCMKNITTMYEILKNGTITEMSENYCIYKINKPFYIEYKLFKNVENIYEKIQKFKEENIFLHQKLDHLEDVITKLNSRIGNGVFLPGYGGGIIDQNCKQLKLIYSITFYVQSGNRNNTFVGSSIEPLTRLENLEDIMFENFNGFDFDLTPLKDCKKLRKIIFFNCFHYELPYFGLGKQINVITEENKKTYLIGY